MRQRLLSVLRGFLRGPWTPLRLTGVTFGVLIVAVAATGGQRLYSYVDQDPTFCRSCHTMEKAWTKWQSSEHKNTTCHSCHESDPIASMEQVVKFAMNRPDEVRLHARVNDEACAKCHESGDPKWIQVADTAGHKIHVEGERLACVKCHSVTVHSFQPPAQICLSCHGDQKVAMTKMAERYCLDCHNYLREDALGEDDPLKPTRETCLDCHEKQANSKVHWPKDAPMQFLCSQCHQPHKQAAPQINCQLCHSTIRETGLHAKSAHEQTDCTACHKAHEWTVTDRQSCESCHGNKVEHNKGMVCANCHDFKNPKPANATKPKT